MPRRAAALDFVSSALYDFPLANVKKTSFCFVSQAVRLFSGTYERGAAGFPGQVAYDWKQDSDEPPISLVAANSRSEWSREFLRNLRSDG